jgi:hypothetical protein
MKLFACLAILLFIGSSCSDFSQPSGDQRRPQRTYTQISSANESDSTVDQSDGSDDSDSTRPTTSTAVATGTRSQTTTGTSTSTSSSNSIATNTSTGSGTSTGPKVVEFRIKEGTGSGPWNTRDTMVTVRVGDTLKIVNDDTTVHRLHTGGAPCPHQPGNGLQRGQEYTCEIRSPLEVGPGAPATYDHNQGTSASFFLRAVK